MGIHVDLHLGCGYIFESVSCLYELVVFRLPYTCMTYRRVHATSIFVHFKINFMMFAVLIRLFAIYLSRADVDFKYFIQLCISIG